MAKPVQDRYLLLRASKMAGGCGQSKMLRWDNSTMIGCVDNILANGCDYPVYFGTNLYTASGVDCL